METSNHGDILKGLLHESDPLVNQTDNLPGETVIELYGMYETMAKYASEHRKSIDISLRVEICRKLDMILESVVDLELPPRKLNLGVYTPATDSYRRWGNHELMKDKGLTGYMLAKEIGARPTMFFGTKPEDYPYLDDLPDMEITYTNYECGSREAYIMHLAEHCRDIDVLILHGLYSGAGVYLDAYRKVRPDGLVYCGLDMNSGWMNEIDWKKSWRERFASKCNVVATSCKSLRDALNNNPDVGFSCRFFPNGFYNPTNITVGTHPQNKENTILTVGRIGTDQKNNSELLLAFALVADNLPEWKLKLVGTVEEEFKPLIKKFYTSFPALSEKVIFTGPITKKADLYNEYAKAKIFALTSKFEGGSPNVYAEALFHGCMFVTSDIDAADDITNHGELGIKYTRGDIDGLAKALIKLCSNAGTAQLEAHIPKALAYGAKYYDWHRNAKKLAYMLFK
jgi:glycosyltransferase involved in cell wall biosynthesis